MQKVCLMLTSSKDAVQLEGSVLAVFPGPFSRLVLLALEDET
jgi:hypothetical protein